MGKARTTSKSAAAKPGKSDVDAPDDLRNEPASIRLAVKLPPKQRIAVDALGLGCGVADAARQAGTDRTTLSRWLHHDVKFIAAFNALILDNIKSSRAEMASLMPLAREAIRKELKKGNGWLALQFMREARSLGLLEVGPTTPKGVKEELKLEKELREADLMKKQVELQQKQHEIDELKEQLDRQLSEKAIEAAKDEGYWYPWMAFYSNWTREREEPPYAAHNAQIAEREQKLREERKKEDRADRELTAEKSRQLIEEADRLQREDAEKKQRGERVKSATQQAGELHDKHRRANIRRTKELALLEQQQNQQRAAEQQSAGAQPSSTGKEPSPESRQLQWQREMEIAEAEYDEADRETEAREAEMQKAEERKAKAQKATEHRPADDQRPAEPEKSNPDIQPFNAQSRAQAGPGTQHEVDRQTEPDSTSQPATNEPIDTDEFEE